MKASYVISAIAAARPRLGDRAVLRRDARTPSRHRPPMKLPVRRHRTAVFAGGCFWGVQGVFQHVNGVTSAVSGYAGGDKATAQYEKVGSGRTGHAESVRVTYDPAQGQLRQAAADLFLGRARSDRAQPPGARRRHAISLDHLRRRTTSRRASRRPTSPSSTGRKVFGKKIVTTIERGKPFYAAEDYHQDYLTLHPNQPYIVINDLPKVENLKRLFPDAYRAEPALVSKTGM